MCSNPPYLRASYAYFHEAVGIPPPLQKYSLHLIILHGGIITYLISKLVRNSWADMVSHLDDPVLNMLVFCICPCVMVLGIG